MFARLMIGSKIAAGFAVATLCLGFIGIVSTRANRALVDANREVVQTQALLEHLGGVSLSLAEIETGARGYLLAGDETFLQPYRSGRDAIGRSLDQLKVLATPHAELGRRVEALGPEVQAVIAFDDRNIRLRKEGQLRAAVEELAAGQGERPMSNARALIAAIQADQVAVLARANADAETTAAQSRTQIVYGGVIASLLMIAFAVLVTRSITGPIAEVVDGARKVGSGLLDHRIRVRSDDEIGELAAAFNKMTEQLGATTVSVKAEAEARDEVERLLGALRDGANRIGDAAARLGEAARLIQSRAQQQIDAVQQDVDRLSTVDAELRTATSRMEGVCDTLRRSGDACQSTRRAFARSAGDLEQVKGHVRAFSETLQAVGAKDREVGESLMAAQDLIDQTRLVAMNGAMEAHRQDGAAESFATAAREIKGLAYQARKILVRTRPILDQITGLSTSGEGRASSGIESARNVGAAVAEAIEMLAGIAEAGTDAARASAETSTLLARQETSVAEVRFNLKAVAPWAGESLAAGRQAAAVAQELADVGATLNKLLEEFAA